MEVRKFTRETWAYIPGYGTRYMVSSHGRVQSMGNAKRPHSRVLRPGRIQAYRAVTLYRGEAGRNSGKKIKIARLVLLAFRGPAPIGCNDSRHLNGNHQDDRLDNLYWGTRLDNVNDARRHGTWVSGERNGHAKLTDRQAKIIQKSAISGVDLAAMYGVSKATISMIKSGYRRNV